MMKRDNLFCLKTLHGHQMAVWCLAVLPCGQLVSGSNDSTIRVWSLRDGKCKKVLTAQKNRNICLALRTFFWSSKGFRILNSVLIRISDFDIRFYPDLKSGFNPDFGFNLEFEFIFDLIDMDSKKWMDFWPYLWCQKLIQIGLNRYRIWIQNPN